MNKGTFFRFISVLLAVVVCAGIAAAWANDKPKQDDDDGNMDKAQREAIEKKACPATNIKHKTRTNKKEHPTPSAPADKALIYVVRPTMMGNKIQTKLAVDGQWVGINRGNNYFFFTLDPGEHYLCSMAENRNVMAMKVEAGKTYYLQQKITMGFMKARTKLVTVDEEEGKKALAKTHPSDFEPKPPEIAAKK